MTEYHRRPKNPADFEVMKALEARIEQDVALLEAAEASVEQAKKVADRWSSTHHRRQGEAQRIERNLIDLRRSLDAISHEVDEYGIPRRRLEGEPV